MNNNRTQITIRLPSDLKEQIQKQADEMGVSFNAMLIILLHKGLEPKWRRSLFHNQQPPI